MSRFFSVFLLILGIGPAVASVPTLTPATGRGRASMSNQMMAAPRAVASKAQISAGAALTPESVTVNKPSVKVEDVDASLAVKPEEMKPVEKDMREKEKRACLQNNIGVGNTFVWASRYSNLGSYSTMIEDVEEPDNNTCFVKVELKSNDSRISVADVLPKYYEMGRIITCGEWANKDTLKKRILDAKKSARTWATVGGAVGGAAVGVGAMELFGNRLIGGDVEGQKHLERNDQVGLLRSQLAVLQKDNETEYRRFIGNLKSLKEYCNDKVWDAEATEKPDACKKWEPYFEILSE